MKGIFSSKSGSELQKMFGWSDDLYRAMVKGATKR
jgi:hypothetical protein